MPASRVIKRIGSLRASRSSSSATRSARTTRRGRTRTATTRSHHSRSRLTARQRTDALVIGSRLHYSRFMVCSACGSQNEAGRKFCGECGTALAAICAACGAANGGGAKFCGECGSALTAATPPPPPSPTSAPVAERRLVTVLFADLVGFTTASENRDAEDTRELLSRYFDTCRRLVELYGRPVEKFIGDAVMAVWGTPVANEDDAERAVRAALDLVAAVADLHPGLRARAGILTGEAAVTLGAHGEGMVAGDLVNTASRIQ